MDTGLACAALLLVALATAQNAPSGEFAPDEAPVDLRIGMAYGPRVSADYENRPTPLYYGAGFLPKIPVFETLVGMDRQGRATPALAERWEVSADRSSYTFHLRPGARFHDGRPCDGAAVAAHFERLGSEQDQFIGMFRYLESVEPAGEHAVRFVLDRPYPLLLDLPLVNPNAVVVPEASRDADPSVLIGTGPFRFESFAPMERARYRRFEQYDGRRPGLRSFSLELLVGGENRSGVLTWALERGRVDAIVEGWTPSIARDKALRLAAEGDFTLLEGPGSSVVFLAFHHARPPFDDLASRRFVAASVDRRALVDYAEQGLAEATETLFAPGVSDWPERAVEAPDPVSEAPEALLASEPVLLVGESDPASVLCAIELTRQLAARGVRVRIETHASGPTGWDRINRRDYDLLLARTWGAPYDPHATLLARFCPPPPRPTAVETAEHFTHPELTRWLERSFSASAGSLERAEAYAAIQALVEREAAVVPLYVPRRIAVLSPRAAGLALGPNGYGLELGGVKSPDAGGR